MKRHFLYLIENKINSMLYIGVTCQSLDRRFSQHCKLTSSCAYISKAIQKYGKDSFTIRTLAIGDKEYIYNLERLSIEKFNSLAPYGYNLSRGGIENTRQNIQHTITTKEKISKSLSGRTASLTTRQKMSATRKKLIAAGKIKRRSLLTEIEVIFIRDNLHIPINELATKFNVSYNCVHNIVTGSRWKSTPINCQRRVRAGKNYVYCDGFIFRSVSLAAKTLGISSAGLQKRLKSNPNYYRLETNCGN